MEATIGPQSDAAAPDFTRRPGDRDSMPPGLRRTAMLLLSSVAVGSGLAMPARAAGPELNQPAVKVDLALQPLNDTGVSASQCYTAGTNTLVSCANAKARALNDQQDGMVGRDVTDNDNSDGSVGFSFSLVPAVAGGFYKKSQCVRDNVTGLTWEGKAAVGQRGGRKAYTNLGDGSQRDASAYLAYVNSIALCGYSDWRLPTYPELQSIVSYGVAYPDPTIDAAWFPNSIGGRYWTSSPYALAASDAWFVDFGFGIVYPAGRFEGFHVRLVR